jgi:hypothetical protein
LTPICIYHSGCPDGFTAAWIVHHVHSAVGGIELWPAQYGDDPPDVAGRDVTIVDFSYKRPIMEHIRDTAKTLRVLDHHKTAAEDLHGLAGPEGSVVIFDMNRSGAMLAWDYYHQGEDPPPLVCYVQDRDLWTRALPDNAEVFGAITSRPYTTEAWDALAAAPLDQLVAEGRAVAMYRERLIEQAVANAFEGRVCGHAVLVANCAYAIGSEVAGRLAEGRPFGAYYLDLPGGVRQWGLRSTDAGLDVATVAESAGGGGHRHAAGFKEMQP